MLNAMIMYEIPDPPMSMRAYITLREVRPLRTFKFWKESHEGFVDVYDMLPLQYIFST